MDAQSNAHLLRLTLRILDAVSPPLVGLDDRCQKTACFKRVKSCAKCHYSVGISQRFAGWMAQALLSLSGRLRTDCACSGVREIGSRLGSHVFRSKLSLP